METFKLIGGAAFVKIMTWKNLFFKKKNKFHIKVTRNF